MTKIKKMAAFFVCGIFVLPLFLTGSVMAGPQTKRKNILEDKVVIQKTNNPFLKALKEAKKKNRQGVHTNATAPNPFIELLKKEKGSLSTHPKNPIPQNTDPEGKEPE